MRFGFVMAGLGAVCAIGVVNNRVTILGAHSGLSYDLSSQQDERRSPGVDLATRDGEGELIDIGLRLDDLRIELGKVGPFTSFTPGPPSGDWTPRQTVQSGGSTFGGGDPSYGGAVIASGANASAAGAGQALVQPPGTPAGDPPPPPDPPPAPGFGAPGLPGALDPVLGPAPPGPGQPAGGGPPPPGPPVVNPPPLITLPPAPPVTPPTDTPPPALNLAGGGPPPGGGGSPALAPASVPEPAIWSAMLLGFGLVGHALGRRRRARDCSC